MDLRLSSRIARVLDPRVWTMGAEARRRGPAAVVLIFLLFTVVLPATRAPTLTHMRNQALKTMALVLGGGGMASQPGMAVIPPLTQHSSQP